MKRLLLFILLLTGSLTAGPVTLRGTAVVRTTGAPLAGELITVTTMDGTLLDTTRTDASGAWSLSIGTSGVDDAPAVSPSSFALAQNYPNPFNPSTRIPFFVAQMSPVRLTVHTILGQLLDQRELMLPAGSYEIEWRTSGSAGVLFYSIEMDGRRITRKMVQLDGGGRGGFGGITRGGPAPSLSARSALTSDSVRVIGTSLLYEPDTTNAPLLDGTQIEQSFTTIHDAAFVVDLHDDVLEQIAGSGFTYQIGVRNTTHHTDIPRLRDGGADAMCFSVWIDPSLTPYYPMTVRYLDSLKAQFSRNADQIAIATTADSIDILGRQRRIGAVILVEGGHSIDESLDHLIDLYHRGMRVFTITWNNSTSWAVSAADARSATVGLSDFGRQVIRTLDSLGVLIDVSHVGIKTVSDILSITTHPIIASHSGASAVRNHYRNLSDDQLRAIAAAGGVVGVDFYPPFLTSTGTATIATVIQHIDHIRDVAGIDHIALGSDFDGFSGSTVVGLENVSRFPALTEALLKHGYSREDVRKILGGNFLRVFRSIAP